MENILKNFEPYTKKTEELNILKEYIIYIEEYGCIIYLGNFIKENLKYIKFKKYKIKFSKGQKFKIKKWIFGEYKLYSLNFRLLQGSHIIYEILKKSVSLKSNDEYDEENYLHIKLEKEKMGYDDYMTGFVLEIPFGMDIEDIEKINTETLSWTMYKKINKEIIEEVCEIIFPILK